MIPTEPAVLDDFVPTMVLLALMAVTVERGGVVGGAVRARGDTAPVARAQRVGRRRGRVGEGEGGGVAVPAGGRRGRELAHEAEQQGGAHAVTVAVVEVPRVRASRLAALVQRAVVGRRPLGEPTPRQPTYMLAARVGPVQRRVAAAPLEAARF